MDGQEVGAMDGRRVTGEADGFTLVGLADGFTLEGLTDGEAVAVVGVIVGVFVFVDGATVGEAV